MGSEHSSFEVWEECGQIEVHGNDTEVPSDINAFSSDDGQLGGDCNDESSTTGPPSEENLSIGEIELLPDEEKEEPQPQLEIPAVADLERTLSTIGSLFEQQLDKTSTGGTGNEEDGNFSSSATCRSIEKAPNKLRIFKKSDFTFTGAIGEGEFGKVSKGFLQAKSEYEVAVKDLHSQTEPDYSKALRQLNYLCRMKHRNVVRIVGILERSTSSESDSFLHRLIFPYFAQGNLLQFMSRRTTVEASGKQQLHATFVKLLYDISQGCEYLHCRGIVHGNLAARNILVEKQFGRSATHYNAKVAEYGIIQLANTTRVGKNYIQIDDGLVVPFRHAPAELFNSNSNGFSFKSDVWSFGVVMWEVLTGGAMPYGKQREDHMIIELIKSGSTPLDFQPVDDYSHGMINIMKQAFTLKPDERPSFSDISQRISNELSDIELASTTNEQSKLGSRHNPKGKNSRRPISRRGGPRSSLTKGRKPTFLRTASTSSLGSTDGQTTPRQHGAESRSFGSATEEASGTKENSKPVLPPRFTRKYESLMGPSPPASIKGESEIGGSSSEKQPLMSLPVAPPPYTPNPLPNHSAVRANTSSYFLESLSQRPRHPRPRNVNYDREIVRKTQELEKLKVQKLQQEACNTWSKMQSLVCQLSNLSIGSGASRSTIGHNARYTREDRQWNYDSGTFSSYFSRVASRSGPTRGVGRRSRGRSSTYNSKYAHMSESRRDPDSSQ